MLPFPLTILLHVIYVAAQFGSGPTNWTASPFNPPSLPLAVKSPYVNAWAPLGGGSAPVDGAFPRTGDTAINTLGWYATMRVDGTPYDLLGTVNNPNISLVAQKSFTFTPTRSLYILQAGPVNVNMSFLSPVEPDDLVRQSMPFSYMYITMESNDGNNHDVQIYTDVTGEWITGDVSLRANWTINESRGFVYLQMQLASPLPYQEETNRPLDATIYYTTNKTDKLSWKIGPANDVRNLFSNGTSVQLDNSAEAVFHGVGRPYYDTLSFVYDFGNGPLPSEEIVFALGVVRDPVVQYANRKVQIEERSAYYWSEFTNIHDVIEDVLDRFDEAEGKAIDLDENLLNTAGQISSDYADLLALSTRQVFGGLEYTLLRNNGEFNTSDIKAFMKDMGSVGSGGVNAVDVMYAAMPAYLYFNPEILGYLLSPLMEYQESTQYINPYAAQDVGTTFPKAVGNPQGHGQEIEQTANMLIMSLAHAQASGNGNLLAQHYDLLRGWADYLVNNTMSPGDQTTSSSDGITSSGQAQTNLVLKGIIGIGAMAKIAEYMNRSDDQSRFNSSAASYMLQWVQNATTSGQLAFHFDGSSSGVIYNLYADKLLQLNLLNSSIYDLQTSFYEDQVSRWNYGIPLDASNATSPARSDWMLFAAASVTDSAVRNSMISLVRSYVSVNGENKPFPVLYHPNNGSQIGGENSPAQGAMFAPLALNVAIQSVTFNKTSDGGGGGGSSSRGGSGGDHHINVGEIVGAIVGGIVFLTLVISGFILRYRRRRYAPVGRYNREGRIQRVKPTAFPPDSIPEPLSTDPYSETSMRQGASSGTSNDRIFEPYADAGPLHVQAFAAKELRGRNGETVLSRNVFAISSRNAWPFRKQTMQHEELRFEVDNLRLEIERLKEERNALGMPPPSYDEEQELALALAERSQR